MAIPTQILPSKCCCCNLPTGSILVGVFGMILGLILMALAIVASRKYNTKVCIQETGRATYNCTSPNDFEKFAGNIMAILSIWNALEVMMSVGLIWGASKGAIGWLKAWLVVSICWIALHCATAAAFIFATSNTGEIIAVAVMGVFLLGMSLLSLLTVLSLHNELTSTPFHSQNGIAPAPQLTAPATIVNFAGYHPTWCTQSQQQPPTNGMYDTATAPSADPESSPTQ